MVQTRCETVRGFHNLTDLKQRSENSTELPYLTDTNKNAALPVSRRISSGSLRFVYHPPFNENARTQERSVTGTVCELTKVQVADIKALLQRQFTQQRAEVGIRGHAQRVAAELEDLLTGRVTQRIPRAAEAFTFTRLRSAAHVLCMQELMDNVITCHNHETEE